MMAAFDAEFVTHCVKDTLIEKWHTNYVACSFAIDKFEGMHYNLKGFMEKLSDDIPSNWTAIL